MKFAPSPATRCAPSAPRSVHYFSLARLTIDDAEAEIVESSRRIEVELGERPKYFSYPYGDASAAGPREFALAAKAGLPPRSPLARA